MPPIIVDVQVTPRDLNGQNVVCRISNNLPHVRGGVIFLTAGNDYQLNFNLNPNLGLTWSGAPFSSRENECPNPGNSNPQFRYRNKPNANTFVVDARPRGQSVVHYLLDFDNAAGGRANCDPIIING